MEPNKEGNPTCKCKCGCGNEIRAGTTFLPGHFQKYKAALKKGTIKPEEAVIQAPISIPAKGARFQSEKYKKQYMAPDRSIIGPGAVNQIIRPGASPEDTGARFRYLNIPSPASVSFRIIPAIILDKPEKPQIKQAQAELVIPQEEDDQPEKETTLDEIIRESKGSKGPIIAAWIPEPAPEPKKEAATSQVKIIMDGLPEPLFFHKKPSKWKKVQKVLLVFFTFVLLIASILKYVGR